jgi:hypothetical protein
MPLAMPSLTLLALDVFADGRGLSASTETGLRKTSRFARFRTLAGVLSRFRARCA